MGANLQEHQQQAPGPATAPVAVQKAAANYKGFVAGVFSGIAKLSGAYSFIHTCTSITVFNVTPPSF